MKRTPTLPPRILFCSDTFPPQVNGVSVVTALSVNGLAERGWECAVVAPRYPHIARDAFANDAAYAAAARGASIGSVPLPGYPDIRLTMPGHPAIARCIDRFRPDVVHAATEFSIGWTGLRAARQRGIPVTTSYHTDFARYTDAYGVPALRRLVTRHVAAFHRQAACTFTPSEPARRDLEAIGVAAETWGRGVDTDLFHPRHRSVILRDAYVRPDACLLLHVGRLAAEKGVERIVEAYDRARQLLPEGAVHLVIAGAGPREPHLRAMGTRHITFLANLDRQTVLPRLYASADAFVFSSLTETLGLVVLEAMASGLPVLATPAGGVADHLRDGINGLAYPANDVDALARHMVTIALDTNHRKQLAAGARATAERLTWSAELDRLDARYRTILAGHARATSGREAPVAA
ncbi:MAG: glycosyltransferase family 1 protein [Cytophagaceae bacterium]|nr:glycosyltransferase family 1 protein [Gemmatimonadaceae bacterium]